MRRLIVASLMALGAGGCGLIDPDVTETPFDLPARMYSFDSATFNLPAGISQEIPCPDATFCCAPPVGPAPNCQVTPITCEDNGSGTNVCTAQATVSQHQMINFGMEVPELSGLAGFINIKVKRISYAVMTNTLNINLPDIDLYLAPQGVMDPMDPNARKFGTMPAIPAGTTPSGDVMLVSNKDQVLSMFTQDITKPLSFIATTTVKVSQSPTGKIDMTITGKLATSL